MSETIVDGHFVVIVFLIHDRRPDIALPHASTKRPLEEADIVLSASMRFASKSPDVKAVISRVASLSSLLERLPSAPSELRLSKPADIMTLRGSRAGKPTAATTGPTSEIFDQHNGPYMYVVSPQSIRTEWYTASKHIYIPRLDVGITMTSSSQHGHSVVNPVATHHGRQHIGDIHNYKRCIIFDTYCGDRC
jgi:hypothetical protein